MYLILYILVGILAATLDCAFHTEIPQLYFVLGVIGGVLLDRYYSNA